MESRVVAVSTGHHQRIIDVTQTCEHFVQEVARGQDGLLHLFAPHATAGLALIEVGSGSDADLLSALDRLLPSDGNYVHKHGSPGHGRDHVLPAFVPPFVSLPVIGGKMVLGTWQSIVLVDTNEDNPSRRLRLSFLRG